MPDTCATIIAGLAGFSVTSATFIVGSATGLAGLGGVIATAAAFVAPAAAAA